MYHNVSQSNARQTTQRQTKDAVLHVRMTGTMRSNLDRAAAADGRTASAFALRAIAAEIANRMDGGGTCG